MYFNQRSDSLSRDTPLSIQISVELKQQPSWINTRENDLVVVARRIVSID